MLLTLSLSTQAQIFNTDDEINPNRSYELNELNGEYGNILYHGLDMDQPNWVPIGSGVMLLATLGGSYLLKKKKENK